MQFNTMFSVAFLVLSASAQFNGPNGARVCVGGAISYEYQKGRCANICAGSPSSNGGTPAFIDPVCSCPAGQADNLHTGAACIDVIRALARQGC